MDLVTLGMFIIDEIHFHDERPPALDILGGAGSWAVFGARAFRESPESQRIGWTIHKGSDFPSKVEDEINSWNTTCNFIDTPDRLTTRGWNKYSSQDEERAFKYTTEKLRIDESQLTEPMLGAQCFHLICTPMRCLSLVKGILAKRVALGLGDKQPTFIWEPVPDSCGPGELANLMQALRLVDVVSPNHQELAALFPMEEEASENASLDKTVAAHSQKLLQGFVRAKGAVVVRCGERGCYVASTEGFSGFLPAYHQPDPSQPSKVIDPTGAGNAFLGAFGLGMLDGEARQKDRYHEGAVYGSIAAGCAVEQIGLPILERDSHRELWNGVSTSERMDIYSRLLGETRSQ